MLNLLEMHSQDIKTLKKDVNVLEHRVSRLEDSQVNIYKRLGGKENDNAWNSITDYLAFATRTLCDLEDG